MPLGCKGITVHGSTIACELGGLNLCFCEWVLPSDCSFSILYINLYIYNLLCITNIHIYKYIWV